MRLQFYGSFGPQGIDGVLSAQDHTFSPRRGEESNVDPVAPSMGA